MEVATRRWCFSTDDTIQLGRRSTSSSQNSATCTFTSPSPPLTGCCPIFTRTTSTWRAKWKRLVTEMRRRRVYESSSPVTCVPLATTEVTALPCAYDRWSYEQNFDRGSMMWDDDEEIDNLSRSFSMRFAHPFSRKTTSSSSFYLPPQKRGESTAVGLVS